MSNPPLVQYASRTDVGMRRAANQDSPKVRLAQEDNEWERCGHLFVVADGMGGHSVGDLASRISTDTLPMAYFKMDSESIADRLLQAINAANRAINDKARENPEFADMGTTCSVLALSPQGAYAGHVGDSRVYRIRQDRIEQLTFDHSLQWEMIRQGRATIDNVDLLHPRNVITRCLGPDQNVNIDIEGPFHVLAGDRFVICSDGLTNHVTDAEIGAVAGHLSAADASRLLIDMTNFRGGSDNVTVVVANVEQFPEQTGNFVDSTTASDRKMADTQPFPVNRAAQSLISRLSLWVFLILAVTGLGMLAVTKTQSGLWLISAALILGFIRFIVLTSRATIEPDSGIESFIERPLKSNLPAAKSPYRATSAEITPELLDFLAQAQSSLSQAATDNGWEVDSKELTRLSSESLEAARNNQPEKCLAARGKAIEMLMKEVYNARKHG
ncbi:MAG: protein phosphatase 2C domain-containing protein [Planctomycetaceae bacterium]